MSLSAPPEAPGEIRNRADLLVRTGVVLFAIGLVATAAVIIPFFFGVTERPVWLNVLAAGGLTVGFAVALLGIVAMVRSPAPVDDDTDTDTDV